MNEHDDQFLCDPEGEGRDWTDIDRQAEREAYAEASIVLSHQRPFHQSEVDDAMWVAYYQHQSLSAA